MTLFFLCHLHLVLSIFYISIVSFSFNFFLNFPVESACLSFIISILYLMGMVMIAALKFLSDISTISWLFICWVILDCTLDVVMLCPRDSGFCFIALLSVDISYLADFNSRVQVKSTQEAKFHSGVLTVTQGCTFIQDLFPNYCHNVRLHLLFEKHHSLNTNVGLNPRVIIYSKKCIFFISSL